MLETIAIILIVLWLLGLVSGYTMGNFIYVLLVIAIVLFLVRLVSGRRVVYGPLAGWRTRAMPASTTPAATAIRGPNGSFSTSVPSITAITGFTYA